MMSSGLPQKFIPSFVEITSWNKRVSFTTGGTRRKRIYTNPKTDDDYFFKGSKLDKFGSFKYPTEFWSEIIASKVGQLLGFQVLDYNIGFDVLDEEQIGCLSENMVQYNEDRLVEGLQYLMAYDENYHPSKTENLYTYHFIEKVFIEFHLENEFLKLREMIYFDAIIGNSDRHQENWGFIVLNHDTISDVSQKLKAEGSLNHKARQILRGLFSRFGQSFKLRDIKQMMEDNPNIIPILPLIAFSPIYDSGCCLGRELTEESILKKLKNHNLINVYIDKGKSEIRWDIGKKNINHFELITLLKKSNPLNELNIYRQIRKNYNKHKLSDLIYNIDKNLPKDLSHFKLPNYRKQFIEKVLILRIEKILSL